MTNPLLHRVRTTDTFTVQTVKQLQNALNAIGQDGDGDDRYLSTTYMVELLVETLSDGSEVHEIQIRSIYR